MAAQRAYAKESRFNGVNITIGIVLLALLYGAVQYGPPYYRQWNVRDALKTSGEGLAKGYPSMEAYLATLRKSAMERVREEGVTDEKLSLKLERVGRDVAITADYTEVVSHPLVNKKTNLHFTPMGRVVTGTIIIDSALGDEDDFGDE